MIIAVDTETEGLDATKFQMGCIAYEDGTTNIFYNKNNLWHKILQLGEKERKRGHNLYVYAHNHQFDFIAYANYTDTHLKYCSFNPFITYYTFEKDKLPTIYFLDSYALSKLPLKDLGEAIGKKKMPMPDFIEEPDWINDLEKRNLAKTYCENDTKIVIEYVKWLKKYMKQHNYNFRRLISASQIGTYFLIKELAKQYNNTEKLFQDPKRLILQETTNKWEIHKGYRGGMIRAFRHGTFENSCMTDINSLYPAMLSKIPIPDLTTETTWKAPEWNQIKHLMGTAKILIRKKTDYGQLGIRYKNNLIFPTQECLLLGTYTIEEINEATKNGAEIITIEGATTYEKMENQLNEIITTFYEKRKENDHNNLFYKLILNSMIGKLAQHRESFTLIFDELFNKDEYEAKGYEIAGIFDDLGAYRKNGATLYNKFYCPIIPAYVNAFGRLELYKGLRKMPYHDLLYCDTDGIIFQNPKHLKNFNIGNGLGEWKIIKENAKTKIYGKKMYAIDETVKLSGISKGQYKPEELMQRFNDGTIETKRMNGLNTKAGTPGKFQSYEINLIESMNNNILLKEETECQRFFLDEKENDITFFKETITEITKDF